MRSTPVNRQRTLAVDTFIARRPWPLPHLLITATTSGTAQTFATIPDGKLAELKGLSVANITGSAATLTLHSIPSGDALGAGNTELAGYSIAANTAVDLTDIIRGMYEAGTVISAYSDTNGSLVLRGHGEIIA